MSAVALIYPWIYLGGFVTAEALANLAGLWAGMGLHGLILALLLTHASLWSHGPQQRFWLNLALVPLLRLVSLALPLPDIPIAYWYLVVGVPILSGAVLAARQSRLKRGMLGLNLRAWPVQILVGLLGAGLGYVEYLILRPEPLAEGLRWGQIWLPALILFIFSGLLEELIFRGLIQYTALISFGKISLVYVPALFALLYLGYRPLPDMLFLFGVATFFGWVVLRTGSISGVTISHGLMNIGLFLVFPLLLAEPTTRNTAPPNILSPSSAITPLAPQASPTANQSLPGASAGEAATTETLTLTVTVTVTASEAAPSATLTDQPVFTATPEPFLSPTVTPEPSITPTDPESAPPTQEPASEVSCGPPSRWVIYTVRPGDTLSTLSRLVGASVPELMQANCIQDARRINAGQALFVPRLPPAPQPTNPPPPPPATPTLPPPTNIPPAEAPPPPDTPTLPPPTDIPPTEAPPPPDTPTPEPPLVTPTAPPLEEEPPFTPPVEEVTPVP